MYPLTRVLLSSLSMLKPTGLGFKQYLLSTFMARTMVVLLGLLSWNKSPPRRTKSTCRSCSFLSGCTPAARLAGRHGMAQHQGWQSGK